MNREGIRKLAAEELGLPTSQYAFASTAEELATAADEVTGFPCFVKPVMSSSGKGQSFVEAASGIDAAWRYAMEGGRVAEPRVIVEFWVSEVSPRPHDTGLVTLVSQYFSEFALHARAILGLPADPTHCEPGASAVIYGGHDGMAPMYDGVAEALRVPGSDLRLFGKPEAFERRRMGVALARASTVEDARSRATQAASLVKPVKA
jgi:formate-dependent phosphoribosylglycinamide formyltransferase (GAR transformylase)